MRTDWNRARFKETGKTTFLANYWPFVGVLALLLLLSGNAVVYQLNQITNDLIELFWVAEHHGAGPLPPEGGSVHGLGPVPLSGG